MAENLVIVESPAKAKTIEKFLGKDFLVKSSFGHVRDLAKKEFGINVKKNYEPHYIISADKKKVVSELKKLAQEAKCVWLASDEDREGEAIAWHLAEVLDIPVEKTRRIVFHEITRDAIHRAIENPRMIDHHLVNAQQARRVLDRLVGFELSPVLWKKIKPSLSAGRVQSVAVRLLVEREREVLNFKAVPAYRVSAVFLVAGPDSSHMEVKAELDRKFSTREETLAFLESCKSAGFTVEAVEKKPLKKSPAPPFTTSTLQQEASRKFNFSVSQTMALAQKLYEAGQITYMRTDSVNLSELAINTTKKEILGEFGEKYLKVRQYKTKSKGAQEAHEAIRPTYMEKHEISGSANEKKLYEMIWKRTIASQMSEAQLEKTTVNIRISNRSEMLVATGEVLLFDGFIRVYRESSDEENGENGSSLIPPLKQGQDLPLDSMEAMQRYPNSPARYTEASLVKKLEELGIGRPSTYAPTISTIQNREYVVKEDRIGIIRELDGLKLKGGKVTCFVKNEKSGFEKSKLFPTDIGMVVTDFLIEHFGNIVDFNFTANVEESFDEIADGSLVWQEMIDKFYKPFHEQVDSTEKNTTRSSGERMIGNHPETGEPVFVKIGRYGPMAQIGEAQEGTKPRFARLAKGQLIETITLEEALKLFALPRNLGEFEGKDISVGVGRFGPYVRHKTDFYSLKKGVDDPMTVTLERAVDLILEKRSADLQKVIREFKEAPDLKVLNGRFGPYISYQKKNFKIPKSTDPASLNLDDCMKLIEKSSSFKK
ncbi:MAG TPA: type I DNA topoisomerase [Bacteroidales bacterium]|nr:type I DNA topoisomerase [Bacteroidales bacterium]